MDGLPPQLQSQHLKFIRDTSSPVENPNTSGYSILNAKRNATQQDIYASIKTDEPSVQPIQAGLRRHASTEKAMPNLSARTVVHTQDDKNERSVDMNDSNTSQHKITIKKVILTLYQLD